MPILLIKPPKMVSIQRIMPFDELSQSRFVCLQPHLIKAFAISVDVLLHELPFSYILNCRTRSKLGETSSGNPAITNIFEISEGLI